MQLWGLLREEVEVRWDLDVTLERSLETRDADDVGSHDQQTSSHFR